MQDAIRTLNNFIRSRIYEYFQCKKTTSFKTEQTEKSESTNMITFNNK